MKLKRKNKAALGNCARCGKEIRGAFDLADMGFNRFRAACKGGREK